MAIYRQGQASMDAQGYVTGYDTKWREQLTLIRQGATIFFLTQPLQAAVITEVISDTSIRAITTGGAVVQKTNYLILLHDSLTVDGLAQDVAETLRYYQSKEAVIEEAIEFFKDFDIDGLKQLVEQVKQGAESAKQSAADAKTSETNAVNARNDAEQFKNAAKASQDSSANSATAAKGSQDAAKQSENKAKEYADSIQPGNFLVKSQNLADLQDKGKSRQNLSLDRFVQLSSNGETNMKSGDGTKQLFVKNNGDWGVWDNTSRGIVALSVAQGGTGARDAEGIKNNIGLSATHSPTFAGVTIESDWPAVTCKTTQVDNTVIGKRIYLENDASNALNVFFANGNDSTGRNAVAITKPNSTNKMFVSFDGGLSPNGNSNIAGIISGDLDVVPQGWQVVGGAYLHSPTSGNTYGSLFTQTTGGLSYGNTASQGVFGRWNQQRLYDTSNRIYTRVQTNDSSWSAWAQVTTSAVSDERMKDVLGNLDVECALSNIDRMEFKLFKFKDEHHTKEIRGATRRGVISQQIKQIDREYVKDVGGLWHLDQTPMLLDGLAAIKALRARDVDNKERISKLEKEVAELKDLLSKLINNPTTLN